MIVMGDNDKPIYVKTRELGPHKRRVMVIPKNPNQAAYTTWVWVLLSILMGVSVSNFLVDSGANVIAKVWPQSQYGQNPSAFVLAEKERNKERNMGSDDGGEIIEVSSGAVDGNYYFLKDNYVLPRTSALAYLAGDVETGQMIISKNESMSLPIASISKLVTALVSKDVLDQHKPIVISRSSVNTYGTMGGLYAGEKILLNDLFYPLLMESSNDAAEVMAEAYGREKFMKKMNEKVTNLQMLNTHFDDPSGLSSLNTSTVSDLFVLAGHIYKKHPELWDITRVRSYSILTHSWANSNDLSRRSNFIGGKNGYTDEASRTTDTIFEITIDKHKRKVAIVLLKSHDRNADVDSIIRFLERNIGFMENNVASTTSPAATSTEIK